MHTLLNPAFNKVPPRVAALAFGEREIDVLEFQALNVPPKPWSRDGCVQLETQPRPNLDRMRTEEDVSPGDGSQGSIRHVSWIENRGACY